MSKIETLSSQLTNMIAAGEVVERPMGIVKELVENAIDAQATRIDVAVTEGGIQRIEVVDNGTGMDATDAVKAFERHATSKLHSTQDLWSISTLGFRGEALPSIASVSRTELETSDGTDTTALVVEYGQLTKQEVKGCNQGTRILVTGLFQKTPARLKHLKSVPYENALIADTIYKFALSHPEIAFSYTSDKKELFRTSGNGDLLEIIYRLYGKEAAHLAFELKGEDLDYKLSGYLIHPQISKSNRNSIHLFINHRMVKPYRIQKAIVDAYHHYMAEDRFPIAVVQVEMDPHLVDVNVHPSKWEVRLSKEMQLEYLIKERVEAVLAEHMRPYEVQRTLSTSTEALTLDLNTTSSKPTQTVEATSVSYEAVSKPTQEEEKPIEVPSVGFPLLRVIGQLRGNYILCESDEGLVIVDQHAAQERVNYERILKALSAKQVPLQELLVPITLTVTPDVVQRLSELNQFVQETGLSFEAFGKDTLLVRQVPLWLQGIEEVSLLDDVVEDFKENTKKDVLALRKDRLATMACHRSIRFNHHLSPIQMQEVIDALSACDQPYNCPHGRPTLLTLKEAWLEREFQR